MRYFNLLALVALLMLGACARDTLTDVSVEGAYQNASPDLSLAKDEVKMVPLEGYFDGYGWFNLSRTNCPAGSLPLDAVGIGEATHLGEFEAFYEYCSYAQVDPTNPTSIAWGVLTADNGDELYVTELATATGPTTAVADGTITGGTGRFAAATGTYSFAAAYGPHPAGFSLEFEWIGEISTVGSSK